MQVRKTQVQICRGGKRKYGNGKSDLNPEVTEKNKMQYTRISKGSGYKYAIGSTVLANIASEITKSI